MKKPAVSIAAIAAVLTAGLMLVVGAAWTGVTQGAYTAAITNSSDTAGSGVLALAATPNTATCDTKGSAATASTAACDGSTLGATVPSSGTTSKVTTLTNTGTITATAARVQAQTCGAVGLANGVSAAAANPQLVRGGITYAQTDKPVTATASLGLNGTDALTIAAASSNVGNNISQGLWFKMSGSSTGPLMGLSTSPTTTGGSLDRVIWINGLGQLNFSWMVGGLMQSSATTTGKDYSDGAWHFVAVTLTATTNTSKLILYVDGASAGGTTISAAAPKPVGYWHIGGLPVTGAAGFIGANSNYLAASVANAFVDNNATYSASAISTMKAATTPAAWASALAGQTPDVSWTLSDPGTSAFTGTYPTIGTTSPCTFVNASVNGAAAVTMAALVSTPVTITPPSTSNTLTIGLSRSASFNAFVSGLHLYLPLTITETAGGWTTTLTYTSVNQQVIVA